MVSDVRTECRALSQRANRQSCMLTAINLMDIRHGLQPSGHSRPKNIITARSANAPHLASRSRPVQADRRVPVNRTFHLITGGGPAGPAATSHRRGQVRPPGGGLGDRTRQPTASVWEGAADRLPSPLYRGVVSSTPYARDRNEFPRYKDSHRSQSITQTTFIR